VASGDPVHIFLKTFRELTLMAPPKPSQQDAKRFSDLITQVGASAAVLAAGFAALYGVLTAKDSLGQFGSIFLLILGIAWILGGTLGAIYSIVAAWNPKLTGKRKVQISFAALAIVIIVISLTATAITIALKPHIIPEPQLTVRIGGGGSIAGRGISCPPTCSVMFEPGKSVTLTPQPAADSIFDGWDGVCTGTTSCTVSMSTNQTVSATFHHLGAAAPEDCITYDPSTLRIINAGAQGYRLVSGPHGSVGLKLFNSLQDAQDARSVASGYNQYCFVDRGQQEFGIEYWQGNSGKPGPVSLEHCTPYDPNDLHIRKDNSYQWDVGTPHGSRLFSSESRAVRALRVAQTHTQDCHIGSSPNFIQYWK
jgi:Divergent InlB B-repeat domain